MSGLGSRSKSGVSPQGFGGSPGYAIEGGPRPEMLRAFLGRFLEDRTSPSPFPQKTAPAPIWGDAPPYERLALHADDLTLCEHYPELMSNMLAVVEPWRHVGINPQGEEVHASRNAAHICRTAADFDLVLLPLWKAGVGNAQSLAQFVSRCQAAILEGGAPSVFLPETFSGSAAPRDDLFDFYEALLLSREPGSASCIFICVSHQLACECLVRLVRRAVDQILEDEQQMGTMSRAKDALRSAALRVSQMGDSIRVIASDGRIIAENWRASQFVNTKNSSVEVGRAQLLRYRPPRHSTSPLPGEVIDQHAILAEEDLGIIDAQLDYESNVSTDMFHGNIVNEEAMLFANWAFQSLYNAIRPHRHELAASPLSWLLSLPFGVEIVASTMKDGAIETACAATCIYYRDFESHRLRRSWTCQFHPELQDDLRDYSARPGPSYDELKQEDGARLLLRLLRAGLSDQ